MDEQCFSTVQSYFNTTCELLHDVEEPSLSSLDESVTSCQGACQPAKEDFYSDGEVVHNIMTSTPQKRNEQRRSVSLVDVSKIDAFSSRPLGNMLASWETIGSQSSVGKSRDSGYIHSGSLISVNSAKLSEIKSSDQIHTILEECTRLKRELEYSDVLINTLQESNNDLRMKYAAASNRISELRLKSVNHCDCCSNQYSSRETTKRSILSDPMFLASSDSSSSSDSSRSPSPVPRSYTCQALNHKSHNFLTPTSKVDSFFKSEEESCSDDSIESPCRVWPRVSQNLTSPVSVNAIRESRGRIAGETSHNQFKRKQNSTIPEESPSNKFNPSRDNQKDGYSHISKEQVDRLFESPSNLNCETLKPKEIIEEAVEVEKDQQASCKTEDSSEKSFHSHNSQKLGPPEKEQELKRRQLSSIEDLLANVVEEEKELPEDQQVFVANEVNGKICVGNFQVWGDSSIKVAPKSPLLNQTSSTIKVRSVPPTYTKMNFEHIKPVAKGEKYVNLPMQSNVELRVSVTPSTVHCGRPVSVYSSFPNSPEVSRSRQSYLNTPNHSFNNQDYKASYRPMSQNSFHNVPLRRDSININVTSKFDRNVNNSPNPSSLKRSNSGFVCENPNNVVKNNSFDSYKSNLPSTNSTSCRENLSNLGVSVTKKDSKLLCPDSLIDGWKSLKSKFEKISLGYLISSDSSEKLKQGEMQQNNVCSAERNPLQTNKTKQLVRESDQESMSPSSSAHHNSSFGKENSSHDNPENIQECWDRANELVMELSRGIARIPPRLEYIQNIGKP